MDRMIDDVARILGTDMSRRKAFGLVTGVFATAFFAMFAVEPLEARSCTKAQQRAGARTCSPGDDEDGDDRDDEDDRDRNRGGEGGEGGGGGSSSICCPPNTCCAAKGRTLQCCAKGSCVCSNGTCAPSGGGKCPSGCKRC